MDLKVICDFEEDNPILSHDHFNKDKTFEMIDIINELGYNCKYFGGVPELMQLSNSLGKYDKGCLYLNFSDGLNQEYSRIQVPMLCELLDLKYSGSTPFAVGLMNNKHFSKSAVRDIGIKVPNGILITSHQCFYDIFTTLNYPVIVKPNGEGSSIGISNKSIAHNPDEAYKLAIGLLKSFKEVIAEELIEGIDITDFIVGNTNNIMLNEVLVYKTYGTFAQHDTVRGEEVKQNRLSDILLFRNVFSQPTLLADIQEASLKIFNYFRARDIVRIDYRVDLNGNIVFLEINSMPTISPTSDAGSLCQEAGIPYETFLDMIIQSAIQRY